MEKWLAQIGLKGRKLESAIQACEENFIDDVDELRGLSRNEKQFDKTFPQSTIRAAILDALASDAHAEIQKDTKGAVVGRAQEEATDRYACRRLQLRLDYSTHRNVTDSKSQGIADRKDNSAALELPPGKR